MAGTRIEFGDGTVYESDYAPSKPQQEYHRSTEPYVCIGGARGGGKTGAEVEDMVAVAIKYPGIPILIARRDLIDLKRTILREFLKRVPEALYSPQYGGQWHKSESYFRLFNGSTIYYSEMKDAESWRSATLGRVYLDEVHEIEDGENVLRELSATLRWSMPGEAKCRRKECEEVAAELGIENKPHGLHPPRQVKLATNPHPGWLKDRFYTPWAQGRQRKNHRYIPMTVFDNPGADPAYIASLLDNPPTWVENFVYGKWEMFENMAFPSFSRVHNVWKGKIPYDQFVRVEGGIDYGSTGTEAHKSAIYLGARLRNGMLLTFYEFSEKGAPTTKLYALISELTKRLKVQKWYADASQFIANGHLASVGIPIHDAPRQQGAVKAGVNLWDRLMQRDANGTPGWMVHESCERLIVGIESYRVNPDTGDYIKKADDEVDAGRYLVMGMGGKPEHSAPRNMEMRVSHNLSRAAKGSSILEFRRKERTERLRPIVESEVVSWQQQRTLSGPTAARRTAR